MRICTQDQLKKVGVVSCKVCGWAAASYGVSCVASQVFFRKDDSPLQQWVVKPAMFIIPAFCILFFAVFVIRQTFLILKECYHFKKHDYELV